MTTETLQRATNHPAFDKAEIVERARFLIEALAEGMAANDDAIYESNPCERVESIEFEPRDGFSRGRQAALKSACRRHCRIIARSARRPATGKTRLASLRFTSMPISIPI